MEVYGMPLEVRTISLPLFHSDIDNFSFLIEASNCGGVAVSGLEMAQNSQRLAWTSQEVDAKLKGIMAECYGVRSFPFLCSIPNLSFTIYLRFC
jgi:Glutamate/Leucine/Phenylalanine/Valine dehydrogenase